jgi:hypothetical protein
VGTSVATCCEDLWERASLRAVRTVGTSVATCCEDLWERASLRAVRTVPGRAWSPSSLLLTQLTGLVEIWYEQCVVRH